MKTISKYILIVGFCTSVAALLTGPSLASSGAWSALAPMSTPRSLPAVAVVDDLLYVFGGGNSGGTLNTVEVYDPNANAWTIRASMPTPRSGAVAGVIDGKVYVVGGSTGVVYPLALEIYNPATDTWTTGSPIALPRWTPAVAVIASKLYIIGGQVTAWPYFTADVTVYDPATDSWTTTNAAPMLNPRGGASAVVIDDLIYVVGGARENFVYNTAESYNPVIDVWSPITNIMSDKRWWSAGGASDGLFYVAGGYDGLILKTVEVFDPSTGDWTNAPELSIARRGAGGAIIDGRFYVVGGHGMEVLNILEVYTPTVNEPVYIDIKPASCPNPINVKSKGVLPVAILGTFDLDVTMIDVASVRLAGIPPKRSSIEDVATPHDPMTAELDADDCNEYGADNFPDLTLKFDKKAIVAAVEDELGRPLEDGEVMNLEVVGNLQDGTPFSGEDVVLIKNRGK